MQPKLSPEKDINGEDDIFYSEDIIKSLVKLKIHHVVIILKVWNDINVKKHSGEKVNRSEKTNQ